VYRGGATNSKKFIDTQDAALKAEESGTTIENNISTGGAIDAK
jgi:hypothetical protein